MLPATPSPDEPLRLPTLLGSDPLVRQQVGVVLFSTGTYAIYGLITLAQAAMGLMPWSLAWALVAASMAMNGVFYLAVRSGAVSHGSDPGLGRLQLLVGVLCMYIGYAAAGPAASAVLLAMASHIVYSMFAMTPRQVWRLALGSLGGLALTMVLCHWAWPERYAVPVQATGLLYALMVVPLIALLAHRVTHMTTTLKRQRAELQAAMARLEELATRDELTRTHNRRHMGELLRQQQALHRRLGQPLAVALLDIDHFKSVNDHHGHAMGDEVLRHFAQRLGAQLRSVDAVARWGGEEFLVLLPATARADALVAMDRLQQHLAEAPADGLPGGLRISFSAGVTEFGPQDTVDAVVERADQAMYRAKTSGRARSVAG
ncbi:GGDEF domain-containing protein [Ideonella sp. DXS22W]|uniref:diguanylate cyclase n=1 Tax=Pseudaquabacterium inlustre TaxID=2984192 RepID=A0ABU9CKU8_9BURK